jgi:probable phosphoglycerate mutase
VTTLRAIRHGESTMNAAGLWQGQADPSLSEEGRRQAHALASTLPAVDLLVTSDLRRAQETAEIVAGQLGVPMAPEPKLRELDVGAWSGLPHAEIAARWPEEHARFRAGDPLVRPGGGESRIALRARVTAALVRWTAAHPDGRLALVTHLGVLRVLSPGLELPNAGTVELCPETFALEGSAAAAAHPPASQEGRL